MKPKSPSLTADVVIIKEGKIVLIKRGREPYKGMWALPGGFVEFGEKVEDAARREALEETGLVVELAALLGVYSDPNRDPRGHTVSVVYLAIPTGGAMKADDDAVDVRIMGPEDDPELAFDHAIILNNAIDAAKKIGML
jgi:8-oxo-dGTP diphosphatase